MNISKFWLILSVIGAVLILSTNADASIMINEIFSDPPMGIAGDANNDGVRSSTRDEFIELVNFNGAAVDLSGWSLEDGVSPRHIFPASTVMSSNSFLAVFGGGSPTLPGVNWQVASTGSLGLNNDGDTVSLFDSEGLLIDQVVYGAIGGNDQSFARYPDGQGSEFILHSSIEQANGALFSPGSSVSGEFLLASIDEETPTENPVVPELPTLLYFGLGWGPIFLRRYYL